MLISRRLKAVVCFVLWSNVASAGLAHPQLRFRAPAEGDTTAVAATNKNTNTAPATATATPAATTAAKAGGSDSEPGTAQATSAKTTAKASTDDASATSGSADPTSIITSISAATTTSSLNSTLFNSTIPAGQLPLQPTVTPAYGVGGIILLATGVVYALVGVRKRWLQTFFSTAYLGALGTTVLILYVMSLPISSNAVQGAYLVAVVATGLVLGALAIVFKEIAEGFGCLLGGFSLGMWLMCLRPGGLIQNSAGSIGFIVGFTVCAYAFYFSHYTRHHALMVCIAFGGATTAVLGIDCFSRAGLKEFWAYVWNLNDDLFPLGTVTYPITRGIKVELAAVILIFCAGVVSQLKLWHLVQERRAKRDADRLADEQNLAKEEEKVGRDIEAANARDREQWEAVYGDGTYVPGTVPPAGPGSTTAGEGDSGVCDLDSEKGEKTSRSRDASSSSQNGNDSHGEIELDDIQPKGAAEIVMEQDAKDGAVTVRVAQDEYPHGLPPAELEAEAVAGASANAHRVSAQPATATPGIVPLPFTVPHKGNDNNGNENDKDDDDRSSVATFADEDEVVPSATARRRPQSPQSPSNLAKRLSQGSAGLFRSLSQRSKRASAALDEAMANGTAGHSRGNGQSKEELVSRRASAMMIRHVQDDDNSSLAVTMDGMSSDEDEEEDEIVKATETEDDSKSNANSKSKEIEVKAQLASEADASSLKPPKADKADKHLSAATASTDIDEKRLSQDKSVAESVAPPTTPANLKDRLPRSLSRVAMSYRTNEWAKHLSNADAPEFETLQLGEPVVADATNATAAPASPLSGVSPTSGSRAVFSSEPAAPLNLADLQQTAETGSPAPAAPRTASVYGALARSDSHQSLRPAQATPNAPSAPYNPLKIDTTNAVNTLPSRNSFSGSPGPSMSAGSIANGWRSSSANQILSARGAGLQHEPIAEEDTAPGSIVGSVDDNRNTPTPPHGQSQRGSLPPVPGVVSFNTPQTLIGQRELLLRSKSQQGMYIGGSLVRSASAASMAGLPNSYSTSQLPPISSGASDAGSAHASVHNGPAPTPVQDLDDLPMSQRREMMRQSSLMSLSGPTSPSGAVPASTVPFDSHQPKRDQQHLPTAAVRQAQLATFRNSVAADLRGGMGNAPNTVTPTGGRLRESMSAPYVSPQSQYGSTPFLNQHGSMASLQNVETVAHAQSQMDLQRQYLISQKGAEAQRREMERLEKERANQAFEERMRRGDLLGAHRDAMRKMQASMK
ncbi:hypothetical protein F503_04227 [Ophiostoma piceae UAMH 11346]|uniref:TM7S3/TM198-like domain-containing protein n=1 Tax=Ophiostoma piceae (strain UAMH 11346) TaxID=1262450 RepID=S3D5F3_OPHP1|nr:hypothetical protein F503_04227 [Ophiostoma piceae UAMH 11346]